MYVGPDGAAAECTVRVQGDQSLFVTDGDMNHANDREMAALLVRVSEVAAPKRNGRFVLDDDGSYWQIIEPPVKRAGMWECRCERTSRVELNEPRKRS